MTKNEISSMLEEAKKQAATNAVAAVKSVGGFHPFGTSGKKGPVTVSPVCTAKDNGRVFSFRATSVTVDSADRLCVYGIVPDSGEFVQIDGMNICAEDLAHLVDCIPGAHDNAS